MRKRVNILGVPIDQVTMDSALEKIKLFLTGKECSMVVTPNTEIVMAAVQDPDVMKVIEASDLCVPDGIGLIYASKIHKLGLTERVTGVDLMRKILEVAHEMHYSIYVLGGKPGVAELACKNIQREFEHIEIKGYDDGYFDHAKEVDIINKINETRPDILFVALGAPKQEKWIYDNKDQLKVKVAMGVGGGVDIWAGTAKRAPVLYQKLGLEWFYRLVKEPWRYKRMMLLPKFMIKVLLSKQ